MSDNEVNHEGLARHVVEMARTNPDMARGLRDIFKDAMTEHEVGSEAHSQMLQAISNLDRFIAEKGEGYAHRRVAPPAERKDA